MDVKVLVKSAFAAREYAYAPYSGYMVGAAILTEGGKLYTGCNVENAAYPASCCAERTALFKAVSEGEREFKAIAVVGGKKNEAARFLIPAMPCGMCRQALAEFGADLKVIVALSETDYSEYTLTELLPYGFKLDAESGSNLKQY